MSLVLSLALASALAHAGPVVQGKHIEGELVSEYRSAQAGRPFWVAIRLRMENGWHTYWRNPGDSGQATSLEWTLPSGYKAGPIAWPFPHRIDVLPLTNFGFEGEIYLPIEITPRAASGAAIELKALVRTLVCKETCIPVKLELSQQLPIAAGKPEVDPKHAGGFAEARARQPKPLNGATAVHDDQAVLVTLPLPAGVQADVGSIELFTLDGAMMQHASPQGVRIREGRVEIRFDKSDQFDASARRVPAVVVFGGAQGFEIDAPLARGTVGPAFGGRGGTSSLGKMLLFAFLGGLILNLMPCVFPVLSIKALGFVQLSAKNPALVRRQGLVFGLGVLVSFLSLAVVLILLRSAGQGLGWGFQLQSPPFVALLSTLLFAMALNLLGLFEVGTSLMGAGSGLASKEGYAGSFFSGVLATVVATPCTAPFMGAALGFALSQTTAVALIVFSSLAVGMALPYVALSFAPSLARRLPRPGRWMETFKQAMAFPLLATVIWLGWVYGLQAGTDGTALLLSGHLLIGLAAWTHWRATSGKRTVLRRAVTFLLAVAGVALPLSTGSGASSETYPISWGKFSPARVTELRAQGKAVFLDFTAAWCVSCKVNERVVFGSEEVRRAFAESGVVALRGDWTRYDPVITQVLTSFGRAGVPLYVFYPAGGKAEPVVLPELLSPGSFSIR